MCWCINPKKNAFEVLRRESLCAYLSISLRPWLKMSGPKQCKKQPLTEARSDVLMEEMSLYAEQMQIKPLLQQYLQRLVLAKPLDPIAFLIDEINNEPIRPVLPLPPVDPNPEVALLDLRRPVTKLALLKGVYGQFDESDGKGLVNRAVMLVALQKTPKVLLETFPKHSKALPAAIERMRVTKDGNLTWDEFSTAALECLACPGMR